MPADTLGSCFASCNETQDMQDSSTGTLCVGVFGIGLDTYWDQFRGLKERLEQRTSYVAERLAQPGTQVMNLGMIDTVDKAFKGGDLFRRAGIDILFLHVTTYAVSSTVMPVVRRAKVPVIVLNLAPDAAIDYDKFNALPDRTAMTGEWLTFCQACPIPEIANGPAPWRETNS